ncbi:uncharacterized protein LOC115919806 isoform X2 [Strongylocentrotus purpuratus]|nr:uncharacterized protein LOC115919806 isoform X2 [Strongylocentrotus purpuratus]
MTTRRRRVAPHQQVEKWCRAEKDPDGFEIKFVNETIGHGLFTCKHFQKGDFLLEYRGIFSETLDADEDNDYTFHFLHTGVNYSIDASDPEAGLGRWINDDHKAPNSVMKKIILHDSSPHLCLFACDDIQVGEEIRYDYGTKDLPWRQPPTPNVMPHTNINVQETPSKKLPTPHSMDIVTSTTTNKLPYMPDATSKPASQPIMNNISNQSSHQCPIQGTPSTSQLLPHSQEGGTPTSDDNGTARQEVHSLSNSMSCSQVDACYNPDSDSPGVIDGSEEGPEGLDTQLHTPIVEHTSSNMQETAINKLPTPNSMDIVTSTTTNKLPYMPDATSKPASQPIMNNISNQSSHQCPIQGTPSTSQLLPHSQEGGTPTSDDNGTARQEVHSLSNSMSCSQVDACYNPDSDSPGVIDGSEEGPEGLDAMSEVSDLSETTTDLTDDSDPDYIPESDDDVGEREMSPVVPIPGSFNIHRGCLPTHEDEASTSENHVDSTSKAVLHACSRSSGIQVNATANGRSKSWDKVQYCPFCMEPQKKLPRHLQTPKHRNEPQVQKWLSSEDQKDKVRQLTLMRNYGNYLHNISVLKKGVGELIVVHRPADKSDPSDYVPCSNCYGFITKTELWKHKCSQILDSIPSGKTKKRGKVRAAKMLLPNTPGVDTRTIEILSNMIDDNIAAVVRSDDLITKFAEKLTMKHGHSRDQENYIRQRSRELGRMVLEYRSMTGETNVDLASLIRPEKFVAVTSATKLAAGFCAENNVYKTPSLALKIGHGLKTCCEILQGKAIMTQNSAIKKSCKAFLTLYDLQWGSYVTHHALRSLQEGRRNNPKLLPLTEDVVKFAKHLKGEMHAKLNGLEKESNTNRIAHEWHNLSEVLLAHIVVFNRKRPGEVSKMTMQDYENCSQGEGGIIDGALSKWERALCRVLWRVEIVGKRLRTVPVLLTTTMKRAMDLLKERRCEAGIEESNTYVFAGSGEGHRRACDAIRVHSTKCNAEHPEHLRATHLRKQIATVAQIMNLKENELDVLANFLGHDIRTHREYYRLPDSTVQLAKVSKVLLKMERGDLEGLANKGLEEVQLDPSEEYITDAESDSEGEDVQSDDSPLVTVRTEDCSAYSGKSKSPSENHPIRKVWTLKEKTTVADHLGSFLLRRTLPGKAHILKLFNAEPQTFRDRSWTNVKDFVRNQIRKKDVMGFLKM